MLEGSTVALTQAGQLEEPGRLKRKMEANKSPAMIVSCRLMEGGMNVTNLSIPARSAWWSREGCACWSPVTVPRGRRLVQLWRTRCVHAAFWKGFLVGALVWGWLILDAAIQFYLTIFG